jgi:aldehyde:ferredoxin oxidoreductase
VRYATISHDGVIAGRGGSETVLGSKNIKAIAVRGTQRVEWAQPRELDRLSRDLSKRSFGPATAKYRELGTAANLLTFNRFEHLPTRNFQQGTFDEAPNLSPEQLRTRVRTHARELRRVHDRLRAYYLRRRRRVRIEYENLFASRLACVA